jgi:hypothetical protein
MKSRTVILFVVAVSVTAMAALATMPVDDLRDRLGTLLPLVALSVTAGAFRVRLPSLRLEMAPIHPCILVGLAALGPTAAALIGLAGVVGGLFGRAPAAIRFVFNLGNVALSTAAASWVFLALGGRPTHSLEALMLPLSAATAAYFVVNTGLVAGAVALEKRQALFSTWKRSFLWSAWTYPAGLSLAVAVVALLDVSVPWALALAVPPGWLLVLFYRAHGAKHGLERA